MREVITYGNSELESFNDGWNAENKKNSLAYLKALLSHLHSFILWLHFLGPFFC